MLSFKAELTLPAPKLLTLPWHFLNAAAELTQQGMGEGLSELLPELSQVTSTQQLADPLPDGSSSRRRWPTMPCAASLPCFLFIFVVVANPHPIFPLNFPECVREDERGREKHQREQ